ncbi:UspA domain-containing protein [Halogeometricum pallidum JCM 14848]|uniref:UspA domain-containing protein n=1 Tax=Halogeometricum pallidum JCM 14848 TaxID=1227487 RepID=M0D738_HALPD|nr:universal stress protein [Halogeometricum pallidum]ELZ31316.1 UspA domain-containing protein [Halogeometricum pallidum JCM 14848]
MYETILVPVDESELSKRVVEQALTIAERFDSTVHAMHVVDDRGASHLSKSVNELAQDADERREIDERREEAGNELTERVAAQADERGIPVEQVVLVGDPAEAITDYAAEEDVDLIVLGAKGRSAVGKFLLGDVAGKVARHARTQVLLVRSDEA